jgi:glutathione S-transferase
MPPQTPDITLYFLQSSRSIRIAWLLEELKLPYESIFFPRENNKAPSNSKEKSGNTLGKAPSLRDGEVVVWESGAISELVLFSFSYLFLCEEAKSEEEELMFVRRIGI